MKFLNILEKIEPILNETSHSFLSYNSLTEEALKIAIAAKNRKKPLMLLSILGRGRILGHGIH